MNANMLFIKQSAQLRLHLHAVNSIRQCDAFANMLLHEPSKMTPLPLQPLIKFHCNKLLINAHTLFTRNSIWVATLTALPFFYIAKKATFICLPCDSDEFNFPCLRHKVRNLLFSCNKVICAFLPRLLVGCLPPMWQSIFTSITRRLNVRVSKEGAQWCRHFV